MESTLARDRLSISDSKPLSRLDSTRKRDADHVTDLLTATGRWRWRLIVVLIVSTGHSTTVGASSEKAARLHMVRTNWRLDREFTQLSARMRCMSVI